LTVDLALQLMGDTLLTALLVSAPILGLSMVVGLAISVLQVITQVQEVSLTFVPKIVTVVVTMVVFGPWMLRKLLAFSSALIGQAGAY
jgi:flagellar biosynthetic protein FliQ